MSKLLVPTDFSAGSAAAARYAFALSRELGCELELLHAYHAESSAGSLINVEEHMEAGVHADFTEFHGTLLEGLPPGAVVHRRTEAQRPEQAIPRILKVEGDEVVAVVMGTHGQSALERVFAGSTTQKVIEAIDHPLFAVPSAYVGSTVGPRRLLWAVTRENTADLRAARFASEFAGRDDGLITFFCGGDADVPETATLLALAGNARYEVRTGVVSGGASDEILDAAEATQADCIVLAHRERGFFANLMGNSTTAETLRQTSVPVLVLPSAKADRTAS